MKQLVAGIDSMTVHGDSLGMANYDFISREGDLGPVPSFNYVGYFPMVGNPAMNPSGGIIGDEATLSNNPDSFRLAKEKQEAEQRKNAMQKAKKPSNLSRRGRQKSLLPREKLISTAL